jgi:hypothetical protein
MVAKGCPYAAAPAIALVLRSRYIPEHGESRSRWAMGAEVQNIVDEIKQSIGLLRRHL